MMPSHRIEYRQLMRTVYDRELAELGPLFSTASDGVSISDNLKKELSRITENINEWSGTKDEAKRIVDEAFKIAHNILLLARAPGAIPSSRLAELNKAGKIQPVGNIFIQS